MVEKFKRLIKYVLFAIYRYFHRLLHRYGVLPYGEPFGVGRGTPVGRYYVENFLKQNAHLVSGRCLEFGAPAYQRLFPNTTQYEVISVLPGEEVDYSCDIHDLKNIPLATFDAIICTQVFEHLAYPERAAKSLFELLAPGGVLLLTAPFLNLVHYCPTDFRRFTPECLEMILKDAGLAVEKVDFGGNCLVGTGSFLGMVIEDFSKRELDYKDPLYPYNILVRARKL